MILENQGMKNFRLNYNETFEAGPGGTGHIRCLGVVPVEIEELLREIQAEL